MIVSNKVLHIEKASIEDDKNIRSLLSEKTMSGKIKLSFEQEPNYFHGQNIEGMRPLTLLVKEKHTNSIIGMGCRSIKRVYINGKIKKIGYLSKLRARNKKKAILCLREGFKEFENSRQEDELSFDMTSIIDDNFVARKLLEKGHSKLPSYKLLTKYSTFLVPIKKKINNTVLTNSYEDNDLNGIINCLHRNNSRYQFANNWTKEDLRNNNLCRDLKLNDFVFLKENNSVIACAAIWDQRNYKQSIIKEYPYLISIFRPILNVILRLFKYPQLPYPNNVIPMAFLSHIAIDKDNEKNFKLLLNQAIQKASYKGVEFLIIGLAHNHPLHKVVKNKFSIYEYLSRIYLVGNSDYSFMDNQPIHIEAATL